MKKAGNSSGTFGAPKPLPGQAGYKVTETEILKKDTDEMESRLLMLQERMKQQQLESAEASVKSGGSAKWKSARPEKGSIRAYGKEVNDKVKKRLEADGTGDATLRPSASMRRPAKATVGTDFKSKDVGEWDVADVSAWLTEAQLQQYVSAFAQNAITGSVLLDITGEDLDYMEIKILGHRKIILKAVEEFRQNQRYVGGAGATTKMPEMLRTSSNPNMTDGNSGKQLMSKSMQIAGSSGDLEQREVKSTHWSQLEPLANNKVSNPRGGAFINPADGEPGSILDEAAERQAFMDAVAEWRKADGEGERQPVRIEREYLSGPSKGTNKSTSKVAASTGTTSSAGLLGGGASGGAKSEGMWKNPFAPPGAAEDDEQDEHAGGDVLDEAAERKAFQEAVMEWRRGPATSNSSATATAVATTSKTAAAGTTASPNKPSQRSREVSLNDSFGSDASGMSPARAQGAGGAKNAGGGLYVGELNEEAEHAEFVKAVDAWRGNASAGKGNAATQSQAEKLAQELELEREAMSLKIKKQREEAERRLQEASSELNKLRSARPAAASSIVESKSADDNASSPDGDEGDVDEGELSDEGAGAVYTYRTAPSAHSLQSSPCKHSPRGGDASPRVISSAPTPRVAVVDEEATSQPTIAVALVESVLGTRSEGKDNAEEEYYVVEVDSDED